MDFFYHKLLEKIKVHPIINTHCHHLADKEFDKFNLDKLMKNSYIDWCGVDFDGKQESKENYLDKVRFNSYFIWLQKSLKELYEINDSISIETWNSYSKAISKAHEDKNLHINILKNICNYKTIIQDSYWNPGHNNNHADLFSPSFRVNMFFFGYNKKGSDHNGNNALTFYDRDISSMNDYLDFVEKEIKQKKIEGCVGLKSALAYDREITIGNPSKKEAEKVFQKKEKNVTKEDIVYFQDYLFRHICEIAAELNMPFQIHTGLGLLSKTNAMQIHDVVKDNPKTKFVLFHCSYPWLDDLAGLLHVYKNVYPDLCWLPIISTSAAERMLHEIIEVGTSNKVCWGCDTWTSEESYGALLAMQHVLAKVLSQKIVDKYITFKNAETIIDDILYNNAKNLYLS